MIPEWYFLCQYAMLKAVPNKNGNGQAIMEMDRRLKIRPWVTAAGLFCFHNARNVRTQDPENFYEEVKSLVTAC